MDPNSIEEMVTLLNNSEDYKVIKRFKRVSHYNEPDNEPKLIGIFVDTETTGSNIYKDKITELALVPFEYSNSGKIYKILDSYVSFQDPGFPIPAFITLLTGITNEMTKGHSFNVEQVNKLVSSASIIIAHNAAFDKKFVEKVFPIFKEKLWGCTVKHINWREEDLASGKLEYLAYKFGVFYKAHRAEIDSLIGIHVLAQTLPLSSKPALKILLENVNAKHYKIWAENSPFDMKHLLKAKGYRWNDGKNHAPKSWYKIVRENAKDKELEFLYEEIYHERLNLRIEEVALFEEN